MLSQIVDGFTLEENEWDSLPLDDFFCGRGINDNTKARLRNAGYLGLPQAVTCGSIATNTLAGTIF